MEILWALIGLLGVITGVDNTAGAVRSKLKQLDILDEYENEAKKIMADTNLTNQLLEAARNNANDYAQMLLNSSPFGTRAERLQKLYAQAKSDIIKHSKDAENNENRRQQNETNKEKGFRKTDSSGSFAMDVITEKHPDLIPKVEDKIVKTVSTIKDHYKDLGKLPTYAGGTGNFKPW